MQHKLCIFNCFYSYVENIFPCLKRIEESNFLHRLWKCITKHSLQIYKYVFRPPDEPGAETPSIIFPYTLGSQIRILLVAWMLVRIFVFYYF